MLSRLRHAHDTVPFLTDEVAAALRTGEPTVSTYHSYAAALVGEHALRIGLEPSTRLLGEAVCWQYAAQVVESYDGDMDAVDRAVTTWSATCSRWPASWPSTCASPTSCVDADRPGPRAPDRAAAGTGSAHGGALQGRDRPASPARRPAGAAAAGRAYTALKRDRGAMDYGDQVAVAARIARAHPEVGEIERGRFGVVLLDEYQDTSEAQRVLLTSLFAGGHPVTAVGDPRQSIYGWRGASAGNLERFRADFAGPRTAGEPAGDRAGADASSFRNGEAVLAVANLVADGIPLRAATGGADRRPAPDAGPGPRGCRAGRRARCTRRSPTRPPGSADQVAALGRRSPAGRLGQGRGAGPEAVALPPARGRAARARRAVRGGRARRPAARARGRRRRRHAAGARRPDRGHRRWCGCSPARGGGSGPRDLDALGRRARGWPSAAVAPTPAAAHRRGRHRPAGRTPDADPEYDAVDERSLVEPLDDPGDPRDYSPRATAGSGCCATSCAGCGG